MKNTNKQVFKNIAMAHSTDPMFFFSQCKRYSSKPFYVLYIGLVCISTNQKIQNYFCNYGKLILFYKIFSNVF